MYRILARHRFHMYNLFSFFFSSIGFFTGSTFRLSQSTKCECILNTNVIFHSLLSRAVAALHAWTFDCIEDRRVDELEGFPCSFLFEMVILGDGFCSKFKWSLYSKKEVEYTHRGWDQNTDMYEACAINTTNLPNATNCDEQSSELTIHKKKSHKYLQVKRSMFSTTCAPEPKDKKELEN